MRPSERFDRRLAVSDGVEHAPEDEMRHPEVRIQLDGVRQLLQRKLVFAGLIKP
jgi:hypothetical protein